MMLTVARSLGSNGKKNIFLFSYDKLSLSQSSSDDPDVGGHIFAVRSHYVVTVHSSFTEQLGERENVCDEKIWNLEIWIQPILMLSVEKNYDNFNENSIQMRDDDGIIYMILTSKSSRTNNGNIRKVRFSFSILSSRVTADKKNILKLKFVNKSSTN